MIHFVAYSWGRTETITRFVILGSKTFFFHSKNESSVWRGKCYRYNDLAVIRPSRPHLPIAQFIHRPILPTVYFSAWQGCPRNRTGFGCGIRKSVQTRIDLGSGCGWGMDLFRTIGIWFWLQSWFESDFDAEKTSDRREWSSLFGYTGNDYSSYPHVTDVQLGKYAKSLGWVEFPWVENIKSI